jgi:hypothetical protein
MGHERACAGGKSVPIVPIGRVTCRSSGFHSQQSRMSWYLKPRRTRAETCCRVHKRPPHTCRYAISHTSTCPPPTPNMPTNINRNDDGLEMDHITKSKLQRGFHHLSPTQTFTYTSAGHPVGLRSQPPARDYCDGQHASPCWLRWSAYRPLLVVILRSHFTR